MFSLVSGIHTGIVEFTRLPMDLGSVNGIRIIDTKELKFNKYFNEKLLNTLHFTRFYIRFYFNGKKVQ